MKANLKKMMGKVKDEVADIEELWLDVVQLMIQTIVGSDMEEGKVKERIILAVECTDLVIDEYEIRWGSGRAGK